MRHAIFVLGGLLLLAECVSSLDPQGKTSTVAAAQAAEEKRSPVAEAETLRRLAFTHEKQGRRDEAEQAFKQSLAILEANAPRGPLMARVLTDLGHLYQSGGRYSEAEALYQRALPMAEAVFGRTHRNVDTIRFLLAKVYAEQGRYGEAETLYRQLLLAEEPSGGQVLRELAHLYEVQGAYAEAEPLRRRLVSDAEANAGPRQLALELNRLAALLRKMDRPVEASQVEARAQQVFPEDEIKILAVTPPVIRRSFEYVTEFEMITTVQYALRTADAAGLRVFALRYSSPGCSGGPTSNAYVAPLLPTTRGEGTRVVPLRFMVRRDALAAQGPYITVQSQLWFDTGRTDARRYRIQSFGRNPDPCYALEVAVPAATELPEKK